MARVIYGSAALADLVGIVDYLLEHAPDHADVAVTRIRSAVESLEHHPYLGRRVDNSLRELVISYGATGYLALYVFDEVSDVVLVARVRHQREAGYDDD
ncbi:MAG: type II toxin-antitoxin system RelE/ParE family toxin [Betaproteobacteria bacterium]|nr:type II toxin-antitoxin system RelE/ParE family toxin [Betaproteobacteria bacterium]